MLAICESAVGLIIAGTKMRRTKFLLVVHRIYMKTVRTQFSGIELWENGSQCWRHTWRTLVRDCWTSVKQAGWQLEVRTHTSNLSTQNPKWCCTEPGGLCAEVFWQLWDNASAQHGPSLSTCIMISEKPLVMWDNLQAGWPSWRPTNRSNHWRHCKTAGFI